jgi:hypothetical protein
MNWTDDGTGINDTGTGPDEGADIAARAAAATLPPPLLGWSGRKALAVVFVGIWIIGLYMNWLLQAEYGT